MCSSFDVFSASNYCMKNGTYQTVQLFYTSIFDGMRFRLIPVSFHTGNTISEIYLTSLYGPQIGYCSVQYVTIDYVIIDTKRGGKVPTKYWLRYVSSYRVGVLNVTRTARKQKRSKESMCTS
jgi:hypothetical protein